MKPINADNPGCDPISSNCVIWQGPDLDCIGLCKGDSISQVIEKLAKELCAVLESLNIDSYDISCLAIGGCKPETFQALIQIIIDKICALEDDQAAEDAAAGTGGTSNPGGAVSDVPIKTPILAGKNIPDAVVRAPETFWYKNELGDTVKDFQLVDLAHTAANMIDSMVGQINTVNRTLGNHEGRIDTLEKAPAPTLSLPNLAPICVAPPTPLLALDVFTILLEQQFCELRTATGTPAKIYEAILSQCVGLNDANQLQGPGKMNQLTGWQDDIVDVSSALTNLWLGYCDIRAAVLTIQDKCCTGTNCDDLDIEVQGSVVGTNQLQLFYSGSFPTGYVEDQTALIKITDSDNNSLTISTFITPYLNTVDGYNIDLNNTPINPASNLIVTVPMRFTDGASVCEKIVTEVVINTGVCPTVNIVPSQTSLNWSFTYLGGAASLNMVLYDQTGTVVIANEVNVVAGPETIANTFAGLVAGIQYKMRLEITPSGSPDATLCPFSGVTTLANTCIPPSNLNGSVIIT